MGLSPEERERIYQEEKARHEARQELESKLTPEQAKAAKAAATANLVGATGNLMQSCGCLMCLTPVILIILAVLYGMLSSHK